MKLLQKYFYLGILLLFICCNQVNTIEVAKPDNLLTHQQMSNVLVDLHLIESIGEVDRNESDSAKQLAFNRYQTVYKKYGVDEKQFKESFNYYKMQPVEIDSIYAEVIEKLGAMEAGLNAGKPHTSLFNQDSAGMNR